MVNAPTNTNKQYELHFRATCQAMPSQNKPSHATPLNATPLSATSLLHFCFRLCSTLTVFLFSLLSYKLTVICYNIYLFILIFYFILNSLFCAPSLTPFYVFNSTSGLTLPWLCFGAAAAFCVCCCMALVPSWCR